MAHGGIAFLEGCHKAPGILDLSPLSASQIAALRSFQPERSLPHEPVYESQDIVGLSRNPQS